MPAAAHGAGPEPGTAAEHRELAEQTGDEGGRSPSEPGGEPEAQHGADLAEQREAEESLSPSEEKEAVAALKEAEILTDSTGEEMGELMVRAFHRDGGVPTRIVEAAEGSARVPDLTTSKEGHEVIARLDKYVDERLASLQRRRGERKESEDG